MNCLQFANDFCVKLGVGNLPSWVMRLATGGSYAASATNAIGLANCCCNTAPSLESVKLETHDHELAQMCCARGEPLPGVDEDAVDDYEQWPNKSGLRSVREARHNIARVY